MSSQINPEQRLAVSSVASASNQGPPAVDHQQPVATRLPVTLIQNEDFRTKLQALRSNLSEGTSAKQMAMLMGAIGFLLILGSIVIPGSSEQLNVTTNQMETHSSVVLKAIIGGIGGASALFALGSVAYGRSNAAKARELLKELEPTTDLERQALRDITTNPQSPDSSAYFEKSGSGGTGGEGATGVLRAAGTVGGLVGFL